MKRIIFSLLIVIGLAVSTSVFAQDTKPCQEAAKKEACCKAHKKGCCAGKNAEAAKSDNTTTKDTAKQNGCCKKGATAESKSCGKK